MRYHEIASGLRMAVSCEEQELLDKSEGEPLEKDEMDEREQELARLMVSRGMLDQYKHRDRIFYSLSSANDIWRDPHG